MTQAGTTKIVQEGFGEAIIGAVRDFAKRDMDDVASLEAKYLSHVGDAALRRTLAETLYGARWIYKLGLALLVRDEEQMAHVRAQLIDYCSVCEGLLSDMVVHGIEKGHLNGKKHKFKDVFHLCNPIPWTPVNAKSLVQELSFYWLIAVASEEGMIDSTLGKNLHWLRKERNSVHLRTRTYKAFIGKSIAAFGYLGELFRQTKHWRGRNP